MNAKLNKKKILLFAQSIHLCHRLRVCKCKCIVCSFQICSLNAILASEPYGKLTDERDEAMINGISEIYIIIYRSSCFCFAELNWHYLRIDQSKAAHLLLIGPANNTLSLIPKPDALHTIDKFKRLLQTHRTNDCNDQCMKVDLD